MGYVKSKLDIHYTYRMYLITMKSSGKIVSYSLNNVICKIIIKISSKIYQVTPGKTLEYLTKNVRINIIRTLER